MSLQAIRQAIATIWLTPDVGIRSSNAYPVETVGAVPCGWVGFDRDEGDITASQEIHNHRLPITVVVNRKGVLPNELAATEVVQDALEARIRINLGLGGLIYPARRLLTEQGVVRVGETEYIGFTMAVLCKEKRNVAMSVG